MAIVSPLNLASLGTSSIEIAIAVGLSLYARASKDENKTGRSVTAQLTEDRRYCARHDWPVNETLVFQDIDISASVYSDKERPDYQLLLEAISAGKVGGIVVTEVSRLLRSVEEAVALRMLSKGTPFAFVHTTKGVHYDLTTTSGWTELYKKVAEHAAESDATSERVTRDKSQAAERGLFNGGVRPYGFIGAEKDEYNRVTNTGKCGVEVVEAEAAIIRECLQRILDGWPLLTIVRDLNTRKIPTAQGVTKKGTPAIWSRSVLRSILTSKRIIGIREYRGVEYPAVWPAIVDRADWEQAQVILKAQDRMKGASNKGTKPYLCTGKIYCGPCGQRLIGSSKKLKNGKRVRVYRHPPKEQGQQRVCGLSRLAEPIDLLVGDVVVYRFDSPTFADELRRAHQSDDGKDDLGALVDEAQGYRLRLAENEDAWVDGDIDKNTFKRRERKLRDKLAAVDAKVAKQATGRRLAALPTGENMRDAFNKGDIDQKRLFLDLAVERIVLLPSNPGRRTWHHDETDQDFVFEPHKVDIVLRV